AGDINADGYADFIVGARGANGNAGKSYVVFGRASWSGVSALNLAVVAQNSGGFVVSGEATNDSSGTSVATAGDINGDGFADLIVGASGANSNAGKGYIIFGGTRFISGKLVQGSGTVTGTVADEVLVGSSGADVLTGEGGVDRFFGGAGNDTIVLTSSDISYLASLGTNTVRTTVDGGTGINTLRLIRGANLDLTAIANVAAGTPTINSRIANIERIDLATDNNNNILTLSANDVLDMTGMNSFNLSNGWSNVGTDTAFSTSMQKHQLLIDGTGLDTLQLTESWMFVGQVSNIINGVSNTYNVYNSYSNTAQLLVDSNIQVPAFVENISLGLSPNVFTPNSVVTASVTMNIAVTVSGTPQLALTIGNQVVVADYASGSGSSTIRFTYTILVKQFDSNGISIAANSLTLNNGAINGVNGGSSLTHAAIADNANILVDGINIRLAELGHGGVGLDGEYASSHSGTTVAPIGDINGDGFTDSIIGTMYSNSMSDKNYVVFGRASWSGVSALNLSTISAGNGGFVLNPETPLTNINRFSSSNNLSGAGDINNDGLADFIVGDPTANVRTGKSYVVFGRSSWDGVSALNLATIATGAGGFALVGESTGGAGTSVGDYSGFSVSTAGDINGDGFADFIIGAPEANSITGKSYLVFGRQNWNGVSTLNLSIIAAGSGGFVLNGEAANNYSGFSVSTAGDINGDGFADLILGAYYANGSTGKSYVVFGKANWSGISALNLNAIAQGSGGFVLNGEANNDISGDSVSTAGDINGDGFADFIIGAPGINSRLGKSYVVFGKANWSGISALNLNAVAQGSGGFVVNGDENIDFSGTSVATAGDINGDGYSDFIIGASSAYSGLGKSYVVFGKANWSGISQLNLNTILATGSGGFVLIGEYNSGLGKSVSAAGDMNGDGYADLIVGAGNANGGAGKGYIIFGGPRFINTALVQASGVVTGTSVDEAIVGSSDADVLTGGGGVDRFFAGAGNDTIVLSSSDISKLSLIGSGEVCATVDGGTGIDTLRLSGGANLNLTAIANIAAGAPTINSRIASIERIDLAPDSAANTLTLSVNDVLDMAGMNSFNTSNSWSNLGGGTALSTSVQKHQLLIDGTALDTVVPIDSWTFSGQVSNSVSGISKDYNVYTRATSAAQLLVGANIQVPVFVRNISFSTPADILTLGNVVTASITMSISVAVSGIPQLALTIGNEVVAANYASGSGSSTLIFTYTILAKQFDANGISVAANSLSLNNGNISAIYNASSTPRLEHGALADNASLAVDAVNIRLKALGKGGIVLNGEATNDYSGDSVASVGDLNGDGYADFIIGAKGASNSAGKSYVVFGRANWSGLSTLNLSTIAAGSGGFVLNGESSNDNNGMSVALAGDINGDSYTDFIVSATGANHGAGKSYVVFGRANWSGLSTLNLSTIAAGSGGFVLNGEEASDNSGISVSTAGDINGDGYADFIIGAYYAYVDGSLTYAGKSYVVFGRANWSGVSTL
ncbi:MAG: FG-GAP-like repeat-containing protein, partial [Methylophilaceae bacterium]|nr:FG-GAP-like repeat-containing protein [Methylophilaceae bacterium]